MATREGLSLTEEMERGFEELVASLEEVPEEAARRRPREGEWSVMEILAHMSEADRYLLFCAGEILRLDNPELPAFAATRVAAKLAASIETVHTLDGMLHRLDSSHWEKVALLKSLSAAELSRTAKHPDLGETTLSGLFLVSVRVHLPDHLARIKETKQLLGI